MDMETMEGLLFEKRDFSLKDTSPLMVHKNILKHHTQIEADDSKPPQTNLNELNIVPRRGIVVQVEDNHHDVTNYENKKQQGFPIQETGSNNYKAQFVVSGTAFAVSSLLDRSYKEELKSETTGVLFSQPLTLSKDGYYIKGRDYDEIEELGRGGYGKVDLCIHRSGKFYVTKKVKKINKSEVATLMLLSHPNITLFYGYVLREGTHEILMEFGGISLKKYVEGEKKKGRQLEWKEVRQIVIQLLSGLSHMNSLGIQHLDFKPDNICIGNDGKENCVKITDFGSAKMQGEATDFCGWTPEYTSPEACQAFIMNNYPQFGLQFEGDDLEKADIFSLGLIVYYILQGSDAVIDLWRSQITQENFEAMRPRFLIILAQNPNYIRDGVLGAFKDAEAREVIKWFLAGNPQERPTANEALVHFGQLPLEAATPFNVTMETVDTDDGAIDTCDDISLKKKRPTRKVVKETPSNTRPAGGGKDIKNQLKAKILRRKSAGPYAQKEMKIERVEKSGDAAVDALLPVFSALLEN